MRATNVQLSFKEFNKHIEEFNNGGKKPSGIVIGYKTYSGLMKEEKFVYHVTRDRSNSMIRYYKGIEIRIVAEKHYLKIE